MGRMSANPDAVQVSSSKAGATTTSPPEAAHRNLPDEGDGRYRMHARISVAVLIAYSILVLLIVLVIGPRTSAGFSWVTWLLLGLTLVYLARYLSTRYVLDDTTLLARTLFGTVRVQLDEVRAIEYASLRDLSATGGLLASWVWGGRMYSMTIGEFNLVYTDAAGGLLVSAGAYPLYISPRRADLFARELSRRARSYTGPLLKDVGNPVGS